MHFFICCNEEMAGVGKKVEKCKLGWEREKGGVGVWVRCDNVINVQSLGV